MQCFFTKCEKLGVYQCSRCKIAKYCSREHQKQAWKEHKLECENFSASSELPVITETEEQRIKKSSKLSDTELRQCRCMFCGEELKLSSEEAAIEHMRVCTALQEQLQSKDQFTIPSVVRNKCVTKTSEL